MLIELTNKTNRPAILVLSHVMMIVKKRRLRFRQLEIPVVKKERKKFSLKKIKFDKQPSC
jgi:hypothetical protein